MSQVKLSQLKAKHIKERQLAMLQRAYQKHYSRIMAHITDAEADAEWAYRAVHAVVFAVLPGKQSNKNAVVAFNQGIQAMARVIRRG